MKISQLQKIVKNLPSDAHLSDERWRSNYIQQAGIELGDVYQELEMSSRFVDAHTDITFSGTHVNLHSHNFYELLYCVDAANVEYLVGAERYRLRSGDIIMIPPGVSHRPMFPSEMNIPYKRHVLWISTEFMKNLQTSFPDLYTIDFQYSVMLRTSNTPWVYLRDLFQSGIVEAENQATGWELALSGNTAVLLTCLQRAYLDRASGAMKAEKPELLEQLLSYVEDHLYQRISLSDAAHQFFVSESTITQLFRKKMGVSFYRYTTQRRLIAAKSLIEKGIALEHVATQTGFGDYSSFFRAFKQEFGISPRQYRNL